MYCIGYCPPWPSDDTCDSAGRSEGQASTFHAGMPLKKMAALNYLFIYSNAVIDEFLCLRVLELWRLEVHIE